MNHLETLLEEYRAELAELEKAYHTFTDVVGNHFSTGLIVSSIQAQIVVLCVKITDAQLELDAHNAQIDGEKEFDKYQKENY